MNDHENTVAVYCSRDSFEIHHLTNHLMTEKVPFMITGETATVVFGIENMLQEICIRVFEDDVERAMEVLRPYIPTGDE